VVVRRRRWIQDHQRLQIYTVAIHINGHPTIPCSHTQVCKLATSIAIMSTGAAVQHLLTVKAWHSGQQPTTLSCCTTQREQTVSPLTDGTSATTRTWPSRVLARTADCRTDMF